MASELGYTARYIYFAAQWPPRLISVSQSVDAILTVDAIIGNQAFQNGRCHNYLLKFRRG